MFTSGHGLTPSLLSLWFCLKFIQISSTNNHATATPHLPPTLSTAELQNKIGNPEIVSKKHLKKTTQLPIDCLGYTLYSFMEGKRKAHDNDVRIFNQLVEISCILHSSVSSSSCSENHRAFTQQQVRTRTKRKYEMEKKKLNGDT